MIPELRAPMLPAAAAARPPRRPLLNAAAALFRLVADAVLYGYLAALWAHTLGGTVVEILGRWVCGEGSAAEAAGVAVRAVCKPVIVRLLPAFFPLLLMRVRERAEFDLREERKEKERREEEEREAKQASTNIIMEASATEQRPERKGVQNLLPKGISLTPFYAIYPLLKLLELAVKMQLFHEEGSLGWRVGSVFLDVVWLGFAIITGVFGVRFMVILVTIPRVKEGNTDMQ
ncbi:unnamed protein product [Urochloa decumbens]|uniref:Uncharacterized protein n=1 Tax=Urochloa decumbens TaxID=240449 RepID=A0ABC9BFP4_9POAL